MDDPYDPSPVPESDPKWTVLRNFYNRWAPPIAIAGLAGWAACVYAFGIYPPVGVYICVLTAMAVVVTIWPPEQNWSKAAWLVVFFSLMGFEIHNLYRDRAQHDEAQKQEHKEEREAFQAIANGINTSISNSQQAFDATMRRMEFLSKLSNENISEVTGGSSFPYVTIMTAANNEVSLAGVVHGKYRVHNVTYSLTVGRPPYIPTDEQINEIIKNGPPATIVGDLSPAHVQPLRVVVHPLTDGGYYNINLSASNGDWNEKLEVRSMTHQPRWDWKITLKRTKDDSVVYEQGWGERP
jgi:hypothetical protein